MDGAAHGLYAYSHSRAPVKAWTRLEYSRATKAEKESRLKAFRKAKLLEEAVYSSELAELVSDGVSKEESLAMVKDLQIKHEVLLEDFTGDFRFILLVDRESKRLTLSVGDSVEWAEKLDIIRAHPLTVPLRSRGLLRRSMNVNPRLWKAAVRIVEKIRPVLAAEPGNKKGEEDGKDVEGGGKGGKEKETYAGYDLRVVGFSLGGGLGALVGGILDGAIAVQGAVPAPRRGIVKKKGGREGGERGASGAPGVTVGEEGEVTSTGATEGGDGGGKGGPRVSQGTTGLVRSAWEAFACFSSSHSSFSPDFTFYPFSS